MASDEAQEIAGSNERLLQYRRVTGKRITQAQRRAFLDALTATCNVAQSAKSAGFCPASAYLHRRRLPDFAQAWDEALASGYDRLEQELLSLALARIDYGPADPTRAPAGASDVTAPLTAHDVSGSDVSLALAILAGRDRRESKKGRAPDAQRVHVRPEETDAALRKLLDSLARRSAPGAPSGGATGAAS